MRVNVRLLLVASLAVLALSATAVSAASAETCKAHTKEGSKLFQVCIGGNTIAKTTFLEAETTATTTSTPLTLTVNGLEVPFVRSCSPTTTTGRSEFQDNPEKAFSWTRLNTVWEKCTLKANKVAEAECETRSTIEPSVTGVLSSVEEAVFSSEAGHTEGGFLYWPIKAKEGEVCGFPATWNEVRGSFTCKLHEPKVEAVDHTLSCEGANVEKGAYVFVNKANPLPAPFSFAVDVKLQGADKGDKYSIYEAK